MKICQNNIIGYKHDKEQPQGEKKKKRQRNKGDKTTGYINIYGKSYVSLLMKELFFIIYILSWREKEGWSENILSHCQ